MDEKVVLDSWAQITQWLAAHHPQVLQKLNPPATEEDIVRVEQRVGCPFPSALRALYRLHNGENSEGLGIMIMPFFSLQDVERHWDMWFGIASDPTIGQSIQPPSVPADCVKAMYINTGWIPLAGSDGSFCLAIDHDPDTKGVEGQVITFGRDAVKHVVMANSFAEFMQWLARAYKAGHMVLHTSSSGAYSYMLHKAIRMDIGVEDAYLEMLSTKN